MTIFLLLGAILMANAAHLNPNTNYLSSLLEAQGFLPVKFDLVERSSDPSLILGQLKTLLDEPVTLQEIYGHYLKSYNKQLDSYTVRSEIFKKALLEIATHNLEAQSGIHTWFQGVNEFTDLTEQEFLNQYTGHQTGLTLTNLLKNSTISKSPQFAADQYEEVDDTKDWRQEEKVSPVKHQGGCGSCYAFTVCGALESAHAIQNGGDLLDLSEQQIVDCSKGSGNWGCRGGDYPPSYEYMKNGVTTEEEYPYTGSDDGECQFEGKSIAAKIESYGNVQKTEEDLKAAVVKYGPTAVGVATNQWNRYKRGVFKNSCGRSIDHAVLAVGYGNDDGDYWILKNSWGTRWGEKGYMRLKRGNNLCRVADDVVYMTPDRIE